MFGVHGDEASVLPIYRTTERYSITFHVLVYLPLDSIDFLPVSLTCLV